MCMPCPTYVCVVIVQIAQSVRSFLEYIFTLFYICQNIATIDLFAIYSSFAELNSFDSHCIYRVLKRSRNYHNIYIIKIHVSNKCI